MSHQTPFDARMQLLDQALQGESADVKARVLNVLIRYQIDPENEFLVIFIAIGHLLEITKATPEEWQTLFKSFAGELEAWSQNFLRTIQEINHQAKTTEHLTQTLRESNSTFQALLKALMKLIETSQNTDRSLDSFLNKFDSFKSVQASRLEVLEQQNSRLLSLLTDQSSNEAQKPNWSASLTALGLGIMLGLTGGFLLWRSLPPTPTAMMQTYQSFGYRA